MKVECGSKDVGIIMYLIVDCKTYNVRVFQRTVLQKVVPLCMFLTTVFDLFTGRP